MTGKHVVVAGASGLVGRALLEHFASVEGCRVTGLSRRALPAVQGARAIAVDLRDAAACAGLAAELADATHLVYAALHEQPDLVAGWLEPEPIETNAEMLRHLLGTLLGAAPGLRHVALLQGAKAYGAHVGAMRVPAREDRDEARHVPNFYWAQEDALRSAQLGRGFSFTILRPQIVFGEAIGSAMNLVAAFGVYGALLADRGEPLWFPGGPPSLLEATDAGLLARALAWSGEAPAACNQVFNVTNGDVFVWEGVWPAIADALGMDVGAARGLSFTALAGSPEAAARWDAIRARHGLVAPALGAFVGASLQYADACLAVGSTHPPRATLLSTVKLRQAGFAEALDTEAMLRHWFAHYRTRGLLP